MRTSSLVALLLAGCALSHSRTDESSGSMPHPRDGGAIGDASTDAGPRDCAEYARVSCAWEERCRPLSIWSAGSLERCEAIARGACEYETSLEGVGDFAGTAIACLDARGCDADPSDPCPPVAGSRRGGEPCRSDHQCAAGLRCAGMTYGPSGDPVACDTGTCVVPLREGDADCFDSVCAFGLSCVDWGRRALCYRYPREGEPCSGDSCDEGLYCRGVCVRQIPLGGACDPADQSRRPPGSDGPCGVIGASDCDPGTRTCVLSFERAFVGGPCTEGSGPRCFGPCVDGVCTTDVPAFGDPCETAVDCVYYACVDGLCAPEPCE